MADAHVPNQSSRNSAAQGERWKSDPDTVENADRNETPEELYDDTGAETAGGITNRPLPEEKTNQASLPKRGEDR